MYVFTNGSESWRDSSLRRKRMSLAQGCWVETLYTDCLRMSEEPTALNWMTALSDMGVVP